MAARNRADGFGWVSRLIHWLMAICIIGMLGFGTYIARMQPSLANLWMYSAHKSVGLILLVLVLVRMVWHRISPPPPILIEGIPAWQLSMARWVHRALYALMLAVPLSGWIFSAASGLDVMIIDRITLPQIVPTSVMVEDVSRALHGILTKLLAALLVLHAAGAVWRHLHGDRTLLRMVRG